MMEGTSTPVFRAIFETAPDGIFVKDRALRYVQVNPATEELFGRPASQLLGRTDADLFETKQAERLGQADARVLRGETVELVHGSPVEGMPKTLHVVTSPLCDPDGQIIGICGIARDITDRKWAEQGLREKDRAIESSISAIAFAEFGGNLTYVNKAFLELWGYAHDQEVLGRPAVEFWQTPGRALDVIEALRTEGRWVGEMVAKRKNGSLFDVQVSASMVTDAAGTPTRMMGSFVDVTERERAEDALRESERKYRALIENIPDVAWTTDSRGRTSFISPNVERVYGFTQEEIYSAGERLWWGRIHPDDVEKVRLAAAALFEKDEPFDVEYRIQRKDGSWIWLHDWAITTYERDGIQYADGVFSDITERKRAEEALRLTRFSIDRSADTIAWTGPDARFFDVNEAMCRSLGYAREELLAMTVHDIDPHFPPEAWAEHWRELKQRGAFTFESHHRTKDGRIFPVEITANHVEYGGREYNCAFARDITERKRAEQQREQLEAQLRQAQKMEAVGRLASGVAHDFNNLVTAIFGYTALAKSALPPEHAGLQALDAIETVAQQASGVTKALLTFGSQTDTERNPLDLRKLVRETAHMLKRILPASINLQLDVHSKPPVWVLADETQLQQVILNLTLNARDAMPSGGTLRLSVSSTPRHKAKAAREPGGQSRPLARLRVSDTGQGMSTDVQERIFEPFFTTKVRGRGTGLGLAVVHGVISDHGGQVAVKSRLGRGSTITVSLPRIPPPAKPGAPAAPQQVPKGQGELILVGEDHEQVRALLVGALRSAGYDVLQAIDGLEVLKLHEQNHARLKLLVLDVDLPMHSGLDCLARIRAGGDNTPVLIVTGDVETDFDQHLGAQTVLLRKPFQMREFGELVGRLVQQPAVGRP